MLLAVYSNNKSAIKFEKKQSVEQKYAKNKQISTKTIPKTCNPQVFKKTCNSTKKQAQICGKPQG